MIAMMTPITRRGGSGDRRAARAFVRFGFVALIALASVATSGCGGLHLSIGAPFSTPVSPPQGFLYSNTRAPMTVDFDNTPVGAAAPRSGSASSFYLYEPFFTRDDISVASVARRSGIETVSYADYETFSVLGVFGKFTIHVHGR
jgi:hypothetical protein